MIGACQHLCLFSWLYFTLYLVSGHTNDEPRRGLCWQSPCPGTKCKKGRCLFLVPPILLQLYAGRQDRARMGVLGGTTPSHKPIEKGGKKQEEKDPGSFGAWTCMDNRGAAHTRSPLPLPFPPPLRISLATPVRNAGVKLFWFMYDDTNIGLLIRRASPAKISRLPTSPRSLAQIFAHPCQPTLRAEARPDRVTIASRVLERGS